MMSLERDILKAVGGKSGWKINPLKAIGLSRDVLRLGLSDAELQSLCKRQASLLLSIRHPDKMEGSDEDAKRQALRYSEATGFLNDPAMFARALREFRDTESNERVELEVAITRARELQTDKERLTEDLRIAVEKLAVQESDIGRARRFVQSALLQPHSSNKVKGKKEFGEFRVMRVGDVRELLTATFYVKPSVNMSVLGNRRAYPAELCKAASTSEIIHPVVWSGGDPVDFLYRSESSNAILRRESTAGHFESRVDGVPDNIDVSYKESLGLFARFFEGKIFGQFGVALNHFRVEGGRILRTHASLAEYGADEPIDTIIGTITPHALSNLPHVVYGHSNTGGARIIAFDDVLRKAEPYVAQGMFLITCEPSSAGQIQHVAGGFGSGRAEGIIGPPADFLVRHLVIALR